MEKGKLLLNNGSDRNSVKAPKEIFSIFFLDNQGIKQKPINSSSLMNRISHQLQQSHLITNIPKERAALKTSIKLVRPWQILLPLNNVLISFRTLLLKELKQLTITVRALSPINSCAALIPQLVAVAEFCNSV